MMRRCLPLAFAVALLSGCAAPYVPAKGETVATVHAVGFGQLSMCRGTERWALWRDGDVVKVPVGQPIVLNTSMQSGNGNVTWYCGTSVEFVPEAGRTYLINDGFVSANRCFIELVRQDLTSPTGVVLEPGLKRGVCKR